jgi:hypothetical protein
MLSAGAKIKKGLRLQSPLENDFHKLYGKTHKAQKAERHQPYNNKGNA